MNELHGIGIYDIYFALVWRLSLYNFYNFILNIISNGIQSLLRLHGMHPNWSLKHNNLVGIKNIGKEKVKSTSKLIKVHCHYLLYNVHVTHITITHHLKYGGIGGFLGFFFRSQLCSHQVPKVSHIVWSWFNFNIYIYNLNHWESQQAQMRPRPCWELVSWLWLLVETTLYSWLWSKPIVLVSESRKRWISHPCCCCWEQNLWDYKRSTFSVVVVVCHKTCLLQTTLGWYYYTALLQIYYNSRLPSSLTKPLSPERAAP